MITASHFFASFAIAILVALPARGLSAELAPGCFKPSSDLPVLSRNSLLTGSDWNDPNVWKEGNQFVMLASSDQNFNFDISIFRLVSKDGSAWSLEPKEPVFRANPAKNAWDRRAVETPSVVHFQGKYHLFYTGYPATHTDPKSYRIGHASSADGIHWERTGDPVVAPSAPGWPIPNRDFHQWITAEPAAVVVNGRIHLYFSAVGGQESVKTTLQVIGLTSSSDGKTWTPAKEVLAPDQKKFPRSAWIGYSTPHAVAFGGKVHLFFDVVQAEPWKQKKIHHAVSADGVTGWKLDEDSIFTNEKFSWTSNEIRSPAVLQDGEILHLWFAGDDGKNLGIGHARCTYK